MTTQTGLLALPYILPSQAQKHVTHNEALRMLDALLQIGLAQRERNTPPETPPEGVRYGVGASPTGAFSGHAGEIAAFQDGAWSFFAPAPGWIVWDISEARLLVFNGTAWIPVFDPQGVPMFGVNTTADTTNRLAVSAAATLFTHSGASHQIKVNKAAAGDTGSLLFQTNWSGRAEMGIAGNDDFSIKVSPNGSAWTTAMCLRATDGNVGIGADPSSAKLLVVSGGDATIGNRTTSNASWCGLNLSDHAGTSAVTLQYGNSAAATFPNQFVVASRQASIQMKFFQGGTNAANERLRFDASGRIVLLNANVGIGTATPSGNAQLDIVSTTRGFLPPRMTETQRDAISAPPEGLIVYNTTAHRPQCWSGSAWLNMG